MNIQDPGATEPIAARTIPTPDGLAQIVSLRVGWWDCLDWMIESKGETLETISAFCWQYVENHPQTGFAGVFNHYLHRFMMNHIGAYYDLSNDNYLEVLPDWEITPHPSPFSVPTPMREKIDEFENHVGRHASREVSEHPVANDNEIGRDDVWEKLPHPYRITLTKKLSFLAG